MTTAEAAPTTSNNLVYLRGRLAADPILRDLPSGDVLATFRLTVDRPPGERVRVDSLECVTTRPRARATLQRAAPGDDIEVEGSLERRFWRSPAGPASRYAVNAQKIRVHRVRGGRGQSATVTPDRKAGASRARTPASA